MSFLDNTRHPTGLGGRMMVSLMNVGHRALADWGLRLLDIPADAAVLDCGCGGGANLARLLKKCPAGSAAGIDYAPVSVQKSRAVNRKAIEAGRCTVLQASVSELPFEDARFDLATAFETVYFWPELPRCFAEVYRVLKPGGVFFLCNECSGDTDRDDRWTEKIAGMTIYNDAALRDALEQAGFDAVRIAKNKRGWMGISARKSGRAGG